MRKYIYIFSLLFMVSAEQEKGSSLQEIRQAINNLDNIPTALEPLSLPNIEEGEELIKQRCLKNGNNETYDIYLAAQDELRQCFRSLINVETVMSEIEVAKPKGDLDIVFKKYCSKSPHLKECIANFTTAAELCLEPEEKSTKDTILNVTDSLVNFICFNEGDRIALFMAEGGVECFKDKAEAVQHCMNATYSKYSANGELPSNISAVPQFVLGEEQCNDISEVQACVVKELEKCQEPTPANIVDSMFNFIRKSTPCSQFRNAKATGLEGTGGSSSLLVSPLVVSILSIGLLRYLL